MNEEEKPDQRYDEAAVNKMAALWAQMYNELVGRGVPPKHAARIVSVWIGKTLTRP